MPLKQGELIRSEPCGHGTLAKIFEKEFGKMKDLEEEGNIHKARLILPNIRNRLK